MKQQVISNLVSARAKPRLIAKYRFPILTVRWYEWFPDSGTPPDRVNVIGAQRDPKILFGVLAETFVPEQRSVTRYFQHGGNPK